MVEKYPRDTVQKYHLYKYNFCSMLVFNKINSSQCFKETESVYIQQILIRQDSKYTIIYRLKFFFREIYASLLEPTLS